MKFSPKSDSGRKLGEGGEPLLGTATENSAFEVGDIVIATAGRDGGTHFAVVSIIDEIYVEIADGRTRRLEKPKKKKIKHLCLVKKADYEFQQLQSGEQKKLTNSSLRKHIQKILVGEARQLIP